MLRFNTTRPALLGATLAAAVAFGAAAEPTHELLLTNGDTLSVQILEETETQIKVNVFYGTLSAPRTFQRSEIITTTALAADGTAKDDAPAVADTRSTDTERPADAVPVYAFELDGELGWDISVTPLRQKMEKAREAGAEYVIVKLDNVRAGLPEWVDEAIVDDAGAFDTLFQAEALVAPLTTEVRADWDNQPTIVFWVDRAMEGMAFIPLLKPDVYFTSDGRMGGVGDLEGMFGSMGDEVVRDKQESLRQEQVKGYAIEGGHNTMIVDAMIRQGDALWYRIENGEVRFEMRRDNEAPLGGGWERLTDTGEGEFADTDSDVVRLRGNDTLTLDADTAFKIGFSKGTADSLDDLLFELGIEDRAYIIDDNDGDGLADSADRIGQTWGRGLTSALRTLRNMERDIANIRIPENAGDRAQQIRESQTLRILRRAIQLLNRYEEVFDPNEQWRVNLELRIQQIENEIRRRRIGGGG
ncbi:MAG: hypothetical protein AAFR76_02815 [Planctomycetota bacterium]